MQTSIKWLKDYVDFEQSPEQIADMLTMAGVPVENVVTLGKGIEKVVTGKIMEITKHPNADKLVICQLNVGGEENIQIVTGAQNVRVGQIVPVCLVGAKLPSGITIKKGKLRGELSLGMLCSASELNLDMSMLTAEQKEGIYILPEDTPLGQDIKETLGLNDTILEFELTANRADCFCVLGLAREVGVLTGNKVTRPILNLTESDEKAAELAKVTIEEPSLCPRFTARVIKNVKIGPSPEWMKQRLQDAGIRSINNVVDITNFVMLEMGQPMHAYDYDLISGHHLHVRRALEGEVLTTLDDVKRTLTNEMIVIADDVKAVGVAGVMGGLATEVTDRTSTVFLEAAAFNSASVRRTGRKLGLRSEASGRFERGVDVAAISAALDRAAALMAELCGGTVAEGIIDEYPGFALPTQITVEAEAIRRHIGAPIPTQTMVDILTRLEFAVTEENDILSVVVPSWRGDCTVMADLAEEVARVYGFDNIPVKMPESAMASGGQSYQQTIIDRITAILASCGMHEAMSFAFSHPQAFDKLNIEADSVLRSAIPIMNPITEEFPILRTTLLGNMLDMVSRNISRKNEDLKLFEIGSVFLPKALPLTELPTEKTELCGVLYGRRNPTLWNQTKDVVDFYDAKGTVERILAGIGISQYTITAGTHPSLHPGKTAVITAGDKVIGHIGEVHPKVLEAYSIPKAAYIFYLSIEALTELSTLIPKYQSLPKYPAVTRDLAFVVSNDVTSEAMKEVILANGGKYLQRAEVFDVYMGSQLGEGKKSVAYSLFFQSAEKTLTDAELEGPYQKILEALSEKCGAEIRK